jgi:hypothetical protein
MNRLRPPFDRLMQMPAARVVALDCGAAHEARDIAHPAADLACRSPKQDQIVRRLERGPRRKRAFELPRPPLVLDRSQRQAKLLQGVGERGDRRLHEVHIGLGMEGIARLRRAGAQRAALDARAADMLAAEMLFGDAQQVPFDLEPDGAVHAALFQLRELPAQQLAR